MSLWGAYIFTSIVVIILGALLRRWKHRSDDARYGTVCIVPDRDDSSEATPFMFETTTTSVRLPSGEYLHTIPVTGNTYDLLDAVSERGVYVPYESVGCSASRGMIYDFERPLTFGSDGDICECTIVQVYYYFGAGGSGEDGEGRKKRKPSDLESIQNQAKKLKFDKKQMEYLEEMQQQLLNQTKKNIEELKRNHKEKIKQLNRKAKEKLDEEAAETQKVRKVLSELKDQVKRLQEQKQSAASSGLDPNQQQQFSRYTDAQITTVRNIASQTRNELNLSLYITAIGTNGEIGLGYYLRSVLSRYDYPHMLTFDEDAYRKIDEGERLSVLQKYLFLHPKIVLPTAGELRSYYQKRSQEASNNTNTTATTGRVSSTGTPGFQQYQQPPPPNTGLPGYYPQNHRQPPPTASTTPQQNLDNFLRQNHQQNFQRSQHTRPQTNTFPVNTHGAAPRPSGPFGNPYHVPTNPHGTTLPAGGPLGNPPHGSTNPQGLLSGIQNQFNSFAQATMNTMSQLQNMISSLSGNGTPLTGRAAMMGNFSPSFPTTMDPTQLYDHNLSPQRALEQLDEYLRGNSVPTFSLNSLRRAVAPGVGAFNAKSGRDVSNLLTGILNRLHELHHDNKIDTARFTKMKGEIMQATSMFGCINNDEDRRQIVAAWHNGILHQQTMIGVEFVTRCIQVNQGNSRGSYSRTDKNRCYSCNQKGHRADQCPWKNGRMLPEDLICGAYNAGDCRNHKTCSKAHVCAKCRTTSQKHPATECRRGV